MKTKHVYNLFNFWFNYFVIPLLLVMFTIGLSFSQATLSVRVNNVNDDLEEYINGAPLNGVNLGDLDAGSSDLELGEEDPGENSQLVGMRFNNITIPKGAVVTSAYLQFAVDAVSKNADPSNLTIVGEASDNALTFDPNTPFNLSSRNKTVSSSVWNIPAGSWAAVGLSGTDQRSSEIKSIIQEIINRSGWASGNSLALYISGTGTREAESFDGDPAKAPLLVINYYVINSLSIRVNAVNDDMEEYIPGAAVNGVTIGEMDAGSSDLELGEGDPGENSQLVGMRFNNVSIPQGAVITNAYIQFTVDATNKNSDPSQLSVQGEATDHALTFDPNVPFNLSLRPKTNSTVQWSIPAQSWATVGLAGADQRTSDIKDIIQEIINRQGWVKGNSLALYITGTGTREAESFDGDAPKAPLLVIEYLGMPGNPTTNFPITKGDTWSYLDNGSDQGTQWKNPSFAGDATWSFGAAKFGYGETGMATTISYGPDVNNKYITTYFVKRFNVSNLAALAGTLDLNFSVDDGAVIYINGNEVARHNIPSGPVTHLTPAVGVEGISETVYYLKEIDKSILVNGVNYIAVEVHQWGGATTDMRFDLELKESNGDVTNPPALGCTEDQDHIACFTSLLPISQGEVISIPSSHSFQMIFQNGDAYTKGGGTALGNFDFTGFIPHNNTSSTKGHLAINHETNPGGVSILGMHFNASAERWVVDSSQAVSFTSSSIVKTERNCSGGITPWETVVTCEETTAAGDANGDGYEDVGWNVEIDPKTGKIKTYGTGTEQKLWAMGRMSHENVVFSNDSITAYYGDDTGNGNIFKFVADTKMNMYEGTLYVLKLTSGLVKNEPSSSSGTWEVVPNGTAIECNNTKALSAALGATNFNGVEDVEINPVDGKIYFTAKGNSRVYRFSDEGSGVSDFETFVGGKSYKINFGNGVVSEDWGSGNDNLTFDNYGNLWVLQDGGRNHVWMVRPEHTQSSPKVELFMLTPSGSEPTGMTFSPDFKFMFISIQSPSGSNTESINDVTGTSYTFNKDAALVIGRKEQFDGVISATMDPATVDKFKLNAYPNPSKGDFEVSFKLDRSSEVQVRLVDLGGRVVSQLLTTRLGQGEHVLKLNSTEKGTYILQTIIDGETSSRKIVLY